MQVLFRHEFCNIADFMTSVTGIAFLAFKQNLSAQMALFKHDKIELQYSCNVWHLTCESEW